MSQSSAASAAVPEPEPSKKPVHLRAVPQPKKRPRSLAPSRSEEAKWRRAYGCEDVDNLTIARAVAQVDRALMEGTAPFHRPTSAEAHRLARIHGVQLWSS
jgi:hypothetical protein